MTHITWTYFHKYKNSVDKLDAKILSQFSKLQDKKPFIGPFLSPKIWNLTSLIVSDVSWCFHSRGGWLLLFFFFWRNKSFLDILSSCDYKIMLLSRKSRLKFLCFETLSVWVSGILPFLSLHAMLLSVLWQDKNGFEGDIQSQVELLGHFVVFLPSQCWCDLTAINNIGRTRRRARTEIGFKKRELSFEDLVDTVNLRYRHYC